MGTSSDNHPEKKPVPFMELLKQAGEIVWENRFLLWFGILMALGSPGSFSFRTDNNDFGVKDETIQKFVEGHWQILAGVAVVLLLIGIFLFLISLAAKAGLIKSVALIAENKETNFRKGWRDGKIYLGKLFGLFILFFLATFVVVAVLAIPVIYLIYSASWISAILVGILAIAILVPLMFIFALTKTYAEFYIVLSQLKIRSAIEAGYDLLLKNILNSIIFSLLLLALGLAAGIILLPIAGIALLILVPTGFALYYLSKVVFVIFLCFAILIFLAIILFISSIFQTYKTAAWTLFFREIAKVEKNELERISAEELEKTIVATPENVLH